MPRNLPHVLTLAAGIAFAVTGAIRLVQFAPGVSPPDHFVTAQMSILGGLILIAIADCTWPRKE